MEKKFKIEKGIPLPDKQGSRRGRSSIYPFAQMEIGDSFLYSDVYSRKLQARACNAARNWRLHSPIEDAKDRVFATRRIDDAIRMWRVK
jgi:hypothetical protein